MANDDRVYDGQLVFSAMDADTNPSDLPDRFVSKAVNRAFRGSINRTRPSFGSLDCTGKEEDVAFLKQHPIQGAIYYRAVRPGTSDGIVIACGGRIFFGVIVNDTIEVTQIATGNDSTVYHTWFVQAEDWVYIQDGVNNPLAWNGDKDTQAERLSPFEQQMPIGTIMAYAHGRVFVSNKYDQIAASDLIYSNGFTDTSQTRFFTENQYWAEGGSFGLPLNMGRITGMVVQPALDVTERGQGELVILSEFGASTINASLPRGTWKDAQIQKVSSIGLGNLSPWANGMANAQCIIRTNNGWGFYSNSRSEFQSMLSNRKISREVNEWVDFDTLWMRQFASAIAFDNRILATVGPVSIEDTAEGFGAHRPHSGMVVLDMDQASGSNPDANFNFRWNGLWTGIRPVQLLTGSFNREDRAIAISYDEDGVNRFYDINGELPEDTVDGESRIIESMFETKCYDFPGTTEFIKKKLIGGELLVANIRQRGSVEVKYRPDNYPKWIYLASKNVGFDPPQEAVVDGILQISEYQYDVINFGSPDSKVCQENLEIPAQWGAKFQLRIEVSGAMEIDALRIAIAKPDGLKFAFPDCRDRIPAPIFSDTINDYDI